MLRQAQHERNQLVTVRPELVEGFVQRFLNRVQSICIDSVFYIFCALLSIFIQIATAFLWVVLVFPSLQSSGFVRLITALPIFALSDNSLLITIFVTLF